MENHVTMSSTAKPHSRHIFAKYAALLADGKSPAYAALTLHFV